MASDWIVIDVIVAEVVPLTPFSFAVIVTALLFAFFVRSTPLELIIAYCGALLRQLTPESTDSEPSLKCPMAVSCVLECGGTIGLSGRTLIDCRVAVVTFKVANPLMVPEVAEIVTVPALMPLTKPVALITAQAPFADDHAT